jgi:licheninase
MRWRHGTAILAAVLLVFGIPGKALASGLPSGWTTVISSADFDGTSLDTSQWSAYDGTKDGEIWNPAKCVVGGGYLTLNADSGGQCGVSAITQHTYGKFAVQARFLTPASTAFNPVFLFWPQDDSSWPAAGEIDYVECYDATRQSFQSWNHYADTSGNNATDYAGSYSVDMTQWRTYAIDWEPTFIKLYVDGVLWHTYTDHIESGPMHAVFQIDQKGTAAGSSSVQIDYFRQYQ